MVVFRAPRINRIVRIYIYIYTRVRGGRAVKSPRAVCCIQYYCCAVFYTKYGKARADDEPDGFNTEGHCVATGPNAESSDGPARSACRGNAAQRHRYVSATGKQEVRRRKRKRTRGSSAAVCHVCVCRALLRIKPVDARNTCI